MIFDRLEETFSVKNIPGRLFLLGNGSKQFWIEKIKKIEKNKPNILIAAPTFSGSSLGFYSNQAWLNKP